MQSSEFDRIVRSLDEQLAKAERRQAALRNASRLGELSAILRVKLASLLALGAWPREDLPGMILSLKEEEIAFLERARAARPQPADGVTSEVMPSATPPPLPGAPAGDPAPADADAATFEKGRTDLVLLLDELQKVRFQVHPPPIAGAMLRLWACRWRLIAARIQGREGAPLRDLAAAQAFIWELRSAYPEKLPFPKELVKELERPWEAEVEKAELDLAERRELRRELDEIRDFLAQSPLPDGGEERVGFIHKARRVAASPLFREELRTLLGEQSLLLQGDIPELWGDSSPSKPQPATPRSRRAILATLLYGLRKGRPRRIEPLVARFSPAEQATALEVVDLLLREGIFRRDLSGRHPRVALAPDWIEPAKECSLLGKPLGVTALDAWVLAEVHTQAA